MVLKFLGQAFPTDFSIYFSICLPTPMEAEPLEFNEQRRDRIVLQVRKLG